MGRFSLSRLFWCCTAVIILYSLAFTAWHIFLPGSQELFLAVNDMALLIGQLLMVPFCLYGIKRLWQHSLPPKNTTSVRQKGLRLVPLMLSLVVIDEA